MDYSYIQHNSISLERKEGFFAVENPATNEILAYVKNISQEELKDVIVESAKAQKQWAALLALQRADILWNWYDLMLKHQRNLAEILTEEMGKPLAESMGEILYAASFVRWFAEECRRINGDILQSVCNQQKLLVLKQPVGVCAAITPWNFPVAMIARKVAPALAAGCSMIVKPATQTPLSAYAMMKLADEAGVSKSVLQVVNGQSSMISEVLCESDIVRKISFTGSTEVGRKLMAQGAKTIKKLSLELGGNAPFIIFDDADIQEAVKGVIVSKFRNSGQTCVCANRIYVQTGIYDEFVQALSIEVQKLELGNGLHEGVTQGPLIDKKALAKVQEHIADALSKGARMVLGGKVASLGGNFFEPTIMTNVNASMIVSREETFGPLAPLFSFDSEDEVIEYANCTEFGLAAYLYTKDLSRIYRVSEALEYGMVGINSGLISTEVAPFGGVKQSGLGREGSTYGIQDYLELKYLCLNLS
ncbi:succinate-semialdehyde dehydrogenase (NADP(+)) [Helicobacter monodelphidis]|uniref:NAD-dependent succinate-semialdehyde dehydrogenase n=1 Tax=Helicobacter sp. 15-1451 TaxID=2004995 RepID=UPI000DCE7BA7|nr:NAD-dependent succinate-semialdehyde dehydrogenase [Helicobacter sp. 15-1451]RAX59215.1 succinate-semialdehyde dehydrogenase (NADP(+)) [Helicobacter sp. 15-1451]